MSKIRMVTIMGMAAAIAVSSASAQRRDMPGDAGMGTEPGTGTAAGETVGTEARQSLAANDEQFMKKVAGDDAAEVALGKLAAGKASSQDVKGFAQMMVDDHGRTGDELAQIAKLGGTSLAGEMTAEHQALEERLSQLSGPEFDREYMDAMIADHEKAITTFQQHAVSVQSDDLKAFVTKTIPKLEEHLSKARDISSRLPGDVKHP